MLLTCPLTVLISKLLEQMIGLRSSISGTMRRPLVPSTLALEGDQVFQLIITAITTDWPDGAVHLITERLDTQCQPDDQVAKIEIETELARVTMDTEESPVELFNKLANTRISFTQPGRPFADDKFYPTVIRVPPRRIMLPFRMQ